MKISERIYMFDDIKGANAYLYKSEMGEVSIIDTGIPGNAGKILKQIDYFGLDTKKIKFIILTHSDTDHIGSAAELKKATGARIVISEKEMPYLTGEKTKKLKGFTGAILNVMKKMIKTEDFKPDLILKEDEIIGGLRAVPSPGHTDGSISLFSEKEVLFSGDAVVTDKSGTIKGFIEGFTENHTMARKTIQKLSLLNFPVMLPGHGAPVLLEASEKLRGFASTV